MGTVVDASGGALPGATITITNQTDRIEAQRQNGGVRPFQFPAVAAGVVLGHRPRPTASSRRRTQSVFAGLGQKQTVNFTLKVAAAKREVVVTSEAPLVNPENPNTATT